MSDPRISEYVFEKYRVASKVMIDRVLAEDLRVVGGIEEFTKRELCYELEGWFLSAQEQERTITLPRPKLKEWLFRRGRKYKITVTDLVLDPPQIPGRDTVRMTAWKDIATGAPNAS